MHPIDARALANYLLSKAEVDQTTLDQLRLQKLAYLAHGWHLGLSGTPLIIQDVHAWPYGPVIPELYHEFKRFGEGPIGGRANWFHANLAPYSKGVVDAVWDKYGKMTGNQLITLTHEPGSPWATVANGRRPSEIRDIPIPNELIRRYYNNLAKKNQAKTGAPHGA